MAWIILSSGEPQLILKTTGVLQWNIALQDLMSGPEWVDLLWEADERKLGIRCNFLRRGFPVYAELDNGEFKIDSSDALDAAGISVVDDLSGVPLSWQGGEHGLEDWYGLEPVHYLALP